MMDGMGDENLPQMNDDNMEMPQGGNDMPPMDAPEMDNADMDMDMGDEFDSNFDAGVEANEDDDPKRYIQQLTGKLSQSLRKYNSELPQPDADLCKYVAGMINKQAIDGLGQSDVKDILNKISGDDNDDEPMNDDDMDMGNMNDDAEDDNQMPMDDEQMEEQPQFDGKESINRRERFTLKERILNAIDTDNTSEPVQQNTSNKSYRNKPFHSPF